MPIHLPYSMFSYYMRTTTNALPRTEDGDDTLVGRARFSQNALILHLYKPVVSGVAPCFIKTFDRDPLHVPYETIDEMIADMTARHLRRHESELQFERLVVVPRAVRGKYFLEVRTAEIDF
jgi:hypothetical protein